MTKHNFKTAYYHYEDRDTLIEQSPVTSTPIEQAEPVATLCCQP